MMLLVSFLVLKGNALDVVNIGSLSGSNYFKMLKSWLSKIEHLQLTNTVLETIWAKPQIM